MNTFVTTASAHTVAPDVSDTTPSVPLVRIAVVLGVWLLCAIAVIATGALDGSLIGTIATLFLAFDATIFTKGYLQ